MLRNSKHRSDLLFDPCFVTVCWFGLGLLRFALSCLAGRVRAISVAMTLRPSLALLLGFALSCCSPVFAQYRQIAASSSGATEAAAKPVAKPVDKKLAADILSRIQKSGADVGVAFRTLDGKIEWFSRAHDCFPSSTTINI